MIPGWTVSVPFKNLLGTYLLKPNFNLFESETQGLGPSSWGFSHPYRWCWFRSNLWMTGLGEYLYPYHEESSWPLRYPLSSAAPKTQSLEKFVEWWGIMCTSNSLPSNEIKGHRYTDNWFSQGRASKKCQVKYMNVNKVEEKHLKMQGVLCVWTAKTFLQNRQS